MNTDADRNSGRESGRSEPRGTRFVPAADRNEVLLSRAEQQLDFILDAFNGAKRDPNPDTWEACQKQVHTFCKDTQDLVMTLGGLDETAMIRASEVLQRFITFVRETPSEFEEAGAPWPESVQKNVAGVADRCEQRIRDFERRLRGVEVVATKASNLLRRRD